MNENPAKTLVFRFDDIVWLAGDDGIQRTVRGLVPVPGSHWEHWVHVVIACGESRSRHSHPEWTAIYYEQPGDPPAAVVVDGQRIEPEHGMVVVLPPGTVHYVERSQSSTPRVSYAMLVNDA